MTRPAPVQLPWKRSRYGFAAFFFLSLLLGCTVLRLVLFVKFRLAGALAPDMVAQIFLIGFHRDVVALFVMTLPLLFWFWIVREKSFGRLWHKILLRLGFFLFWAAQVFLFFTEYYFFDEFKSRFNTVAVDYLHDRTEVFGNIWQSYPVALIVGVCAGLSLAWNLMAFRYFKQMWFQPVRARNRFFYLVGAVGLSALLGWTVNLKELNFSKDRTLNEIANNGSISFVAAFLTRNLDYNAFYLTMDKAEAYQRVRGLLYERNVEFVEQGSSIRRRVAGDASKPKLNVVILMEESLGSEFWGSLGRTNTLTPEMDRLAIQEGLLFTNIYASGNRTVRGFEGVLSSFPPLPGDSIVKRDRSDNVETIARVLKRDGYNTVFFYGGRGMFDSMKSYTMNNGWDRFLEHNPPFNDDFPHPNFTTIWGVSDEEVFARAIQEFRALDKTGQPFLGTVMSVSNHKPYTYPPGRILEDPLKPKPTRRKVVKYSDWCLGQFFQAAKKEAFWTNTIFVVVADHGARVYGSQSIPIHSYEIPLVILGPAVVKEPARVGQLGCSLDVAPTVLGLLGRPYETMFFGRDLLKMEPERGRVFINHNRDIGVMERERLTVLGLMQSEEFYEGNPKEVDMKPMGQPDNIAREVQRDAIATFQVADDLYMNELYRLEVAARKRSVVSAVSTNQPAN